MNVKWLEAANHVIKRLREQLAISRWWSAAWKASAKFNRDKLLIELDRVKRLIAEWHKQQDRAEATEKRVAELEEALEWLDTAIMPDERKYDRNGWGRIHKQTLREFERKVKAALNKSK